MLTGGVKIAAVQLCSTPDPLENLDLMEAALAEAGEADLVVFPEATMACAGAPWLELAEPLDGPFANRVRGLAARHDTTIAVGMFTPDPRPAGAAGPDRCFNTLFVTGPGGDAFYHKLHLFDAFGFLESERIAPGELPALVEVAGVTVGLAICYDVRFPDLFTYYAAHGAQAVIVPASWQAGPGKIDHWVTLARARALDSTSYVVGCGQADPDASGRPPRPGPLGVGHSLAVGPDGAVLAELGAGPGVLTVDVDPAEVARVRGVLPVLNNARFTPVLDGVESVWP